MPELVARTTRLAEAALEAGIGLTIDAEEAERLEMSLDIIAAVARAPSLAGWDGLGMAVQAYQRRAPAVIAWADALGRETGRRLTVRLVKGAYWDSEIKRGQERGLPDYPVFTRKAATDVSYLACARAMLDAPGIYPAFATHNALTVATILGWAGPREDFEFQRLHGMGGGLYERLMRSRAWPRGSTPRSAAIATCWPTSSAACWRTGPTPASCTRSPTRAFPTTSCSPTPFPSLRPPACNPTAGSPTPWTSTPPNAATAPAST